VAACRYSAVFHDAHAWDASAAWYAAEVSEGERSGDETPWSNTPHFERCEGSGKKNASCATVRDVVEESISTLGRLLDQFHVDVYAAGHVHSYSTTWPIFGGMVAKKSLVDPNGCDIYFLGSSCSEINVHRLSISCGLTRACPQDGARPGG
jgi:hypothetical protein